MPDRVSPASPGPRPSVLILGRRVRAATRSLRLRITLLATAAVLLAFVVAGVTLVASIRGTLVGRLRQTAASQVTAVATQLERGRSPEQAPFSVDESGTAVVVLDPDERVVGSSGPAFIMMRRRLSDVLQQVDDQQFRERGEGVRIALGSADLVAAERTVALPDGDYRVVAFSPLAEASRSIDIVVRALIVAGSALTVFVGGLCWVAVDRALRPVEQIRRRAEAISHADPDERLPVPETGDEIERLTHTLNEMLQRLAAAMQRQREFVSDTAHELRTPLATIRTELEVALAHDDADGWRVTARQLLDDHHRVERLAHDLLVLARLDEATAGPRERVRLDEVVAGETTMLADDAVDLAPTTVDGDVVALERAVRNLVDNALRHAATRVEVAVLATDAHAVVRVDDDGPGVPEAQRDRVFDRFARLDEARSRDGGGSGIGLAIVRRVADVHDGTVTVHDAPLGGARFELRLPRPRAPNR